MAPAELIVKTLFGLCMCQYFYANKKTGAFCFVGKNLVNIGQCSGIELLLVPVFFVIHLG
jgi:hypothetical protein